MAKLRRCDECGTLLKFSENTDALLEVFCRKCTAKLNRKLEQLPAVSFDFIIPFGKYKGNTLLHISEVDPGYITWLNTRDIFRIDPTLLLQSLNNSIEPDFEDLHSDWGLR
jgi:uncharacterized protein (DUF3820 family)